MNLLAHAHLGSDLNRKTNCYNILWDYISRTGAEKQCDAAARGRALHILIDKEADRSAYYKQHRNVISPARRKAAKILFDLFSDYFLVKHWAEFSDQPVERFIQEAYQNLRIEAPSIGGRGEEIALNMGRNNWFGDYGTIEGQAKVLQRISARSSSRLASILTGAEEELSTNEAELEKGFITFYKEIQVRVSLH